MTEPVVKLSQKKTEFLRDLLQKAIKFMVEVQVTNDAKGTYFVQYPTIAAGYPYIEKFVSNAPFYVKGLLDEVDRLKADLRWVKDKSTDKGNAEALLAEIDLYVSDSLKDPAETTNLIDLPDPGIQKQREVLNTKLLEKMRSINDPALQQAEGIGL